MLSPVKHSHAPQAIFRLAWTLLETGAEQQKSWLVNTEEKEEDLYGLKWAVWGIFMHSERGGGVDGPEEGGGISIATVKSPAVMFGLR